MYLNCGDYAANSLINKYFDIIVTLCDYNEKNRPIGQPCWDNSLFPIPTIEAISAMTEFGYGEDEIIHWASLIASVATWALDPYIVMFDPDLAGLLAWHRNDLHMDSNTLRYPLKDGKQVVRCCYISHTFKTEDETYGGTFMRVDYNPRTGKWHQVFNFVSAQYEVLSFAFPLLNGLSIEDCIYHEKKPEHIEITKKSGLEDMIKLALQLRLYSISMPMTDATTTPPQLYGRSQMVKSEPIDLLPPGSTVRYAYIGCDAGNVLRSFRKGNSCIPYKGDSNTGNWLPRPIPELDRERGYDALYPDWRYPDKW